MLRSVLFAALVLAGWLARGDVVSYTTTTTEADVVLTSVSVQRGTGTVVFDAKRLIGVRLVAFNSPSPTIAACPGGAPPPAGARAALLQDNSLNTGILNPGGQQEPLTTDPVLAGPNATPGMAVRFTRPVVNLPGDDVVVFELHRRLASPPKGDAFHVSPLHFAPGLRSLTVHAFDVHLDHPKVLPIAGFDLYRFAGASRSLADIERAGIARTNGAPLDDFKIMAVGIDLSDLGYAPAAEVEGLFLQNKGAGGMMLDPLLLAGLPAPEPPNVLAKAPPIVTPRSPRQMTLEELLDGPLDGIDEIVFAVRRCGFDHWYANFGRYSANISEYPPQRGVAGETLRPLFGQGGRLCKLHIRTGTLTVLLDDPNGGVRDPQVHYDGKKILFAYRKGGEDPYHLYEINTDGTRLRQLTDGPYDDIEPAYCPDGSIVFPSGRARRFVNCYRTPVATLYRCDADGGGIRMVSSSIEHDNTPWMLPDGRVLYTRWEYVDRSQFCFHHLWTMNPDGTGQMVYFGNQRRGTSMLDAKPIPGTNRIVASFSPGHGAPGHMGFVTVVDPTLGPDWDPAARKISRGRAMFRDPYPISATCFLVADNKGIHVMDGHGHTQTLYARPKGETLTFHEPRALRPRPRERVIAPRTDLRRDTGTLILTDIYTGRNMAGVERGEIAKLLVLEQLAKPISFSGGMWPISAGGTFTLARVLGTVPVEPDGSAYLQVPALRSLFFVALDKNNLSVKRMQSFLTLEPGETQGCVGCHENRVLAPVASADFAAMRRPPSPIEPITDVPDVLGFARDVQPILDRHCLRCHNAEKAEGRVDLSGDHTPLFTQSYWELTCRGLYSDGRNEPAGNLPPRTIGSSASRLLALLDGSHYDAKGTPLERKTVRLWIESSAVYAGTYAALGSGMHPVEFPLDVMERRCGPCHGAEPKGRRRIGKGKLYFRFGSRGPHLPLVHDFRNLQSIRGSIGYYKFGSARPPQSLCNLSRPAMSRLLRAPLATKARGLGWCTPQVFADTSDPDYQKLLAPIAAASAKHHREKRFDMPGFVPNVYYTRMLQRYGVLSRSLDVDRPYDFRAAEQAYWRSFWYVPAARFGR